VVGLYWCPLIIDHLEKTAILYDFSPTQDQLEFFCTLYQPKSNDIEQPIESNRFRLTTEWRSNMTQDDYAKRFDQVKRYIKSGDCYQINLAQRFTAHYEGDLWQAYEYLSQINKAPFSAYFNFGQGALLSLSPERFIRVDGHRVMTQPIKGTRARSENPETDRALKQELLTSEKDRAENLMIVDLLRNDLGRTATPGSVNVTELFGCYSFPSVHHLISTIESTIAPPTTSVDVLKHAFPGGSITGAPKIRAMQIIEELEPHRRHFYCGSIAYFSFNGHMDSSILIRTLMAKDQTLYAWAGGGLVDDSECHLEYQETFAKLSKILQPLSRF
jgi:para-aminobenzoate synthetase component 1